MSWNGGWRPYVPVAQRRRQAARVVAEQRKAGREITPVVVAGRKIATTFWGEAWCRNLESYSDFANRLPRGRTYVRNGSVVDLRVEAGRVTALVSGSEVYRVDIEVKPLPQTRWTETKQRCAGQIGSLVELLQGTISKGVMEIVTRRGEGLFPSPREISLSCTCPDWASMCKHVAAALYGIGARLDHAPQLLFTLRGIDPAELAEHALEQGPKARTGRPRKTLASEDLSSVFGIDIEPADAPVRKPKRATKGTRAGSTRDGTATRGGAPSKKTTTKARKKVATKARKKVATKARKKVATKARKKVATKARKKVTRETKKSILGKRAARTASRAGDDGRDRAAPTKSKRSAKARGSKTGKAAVKTKKRHPAAAPGERQSIRQMNP